MSKTITFELHEYDDNNQRVIIEISGEKKPFLIAYSNNGVFNSTHNNKLNNVANAIGDLLLEIIEDDSSSQDTEFAINDEAELP